MLAVIYAINTLLDLCQTCHAYLQGGAQSASCGEHGQQAWRPTEPCSCALSAGVWAAFSLLQACTLWQLACLPLPA